MVVGRISTEYFVDREEELSVLEKNAHALLKGRYKNFVLANPRRMGKTTLIAKHIEDINASGAYGKVIPVYVSALTCPGWAGLADRLLDTAFEEYASKTGDRLIIKRLSSWARGKLKNIFERVEKVEAELGSAAGEYFKLRTTMERAPEEAISLVEMALRTLEEFAGKKKVFFEVFIDEFQRIRKYEAYQDVLGAVREAIQHQERCSYVLSGSSVTFMQEIYTRESSPFSKQLMPLELSFFEPGDIEGYVRLHGKEYSPQGIASLATATKGIPDYVAKTVDEAGEIHPAEVEEAFSKVVMREAKAFAELFETMTLSQQRIIISIASGKQRYAELNEVLGGGSTGTILSNMVLNGTLIKTGKGQYDIFDVGLKRYVQSSIGG